VNASFVYDGLGRRESKTISTNVTEFLYDGVNPVQETSGATVLANILTGLGVDEFLTRTDVPAGITSSFLTDALGSALALADAAGAVQTEYTSEPFGRTTVTGASNTNPFEFTGRENDGTGLYYYRARYYHPALQRFTSEDPILHAGAPQVSFSLRVLLFNPQMLNPYLYGENNPILLVDPSGLIACEGQWKTVYSQNIFPGNFCVCFWLCIPCDGPTIWGGNPYTLPLTGGVLTGSRLGRCVCPKPGPERTVLVTNSNSSAV
jgi:RHS repeat-associated protein